MVKTCRNGKTYALIINHYTYSVCNVLVYSNDTVLQITMTAEFDRLAGQVATNIQKLVNNVSSMQRMVQHVDTQGGSI